MKRFLIEVCADSMISAREAVRAGAHRLELCANLIIGGTTPSPHFIRSAAALGVPVNVLIRPRFGDFLFTQDEKEEQLCQIRELAALGAGGAVVGALLPDGTLDTPFLHECREAAKGLRMTLHRAFDLSADPFEALETAIEIGFDTILTSGLAPSAQQGREMLRRLNERAAGRITILAGGSVRADSVRQLAEETGVRAFHLSAKKTAESGMVFRREGVPMGLPVMSEYECFVVDGDAVRAAKAALEA